MLHEATIRARARGSPRRSEEGGGDGRPRRGGSLPLAGLPSFACALEESLAEPLRLGDPPVVGIVRDGRLLLDCRTLGDDELDAVIAAAHASRP